MHPNTHGSWGVTHDDRGVPHSEAIIHETPNRKNVHKTERRHAEAYKYFTSSHPLLHSNHPNEQSFKRERSIALQAVTALVSKSSTSITP